MRPAPAALSLALAGLLPLGGSASAALPHDDSGPAIGPNCVRPVAIPPIEGVFDVEWAPDGWRLAIVRTERLPSKDHVTGYVELELLETLDLRTGELRFFGVATRPQWSGSGRYLSFWGPEADFLIVEDRGTIVAHLVPSMPEYRWAGDQLLYVEKSTIRAWSEEPTTIRKFAFTEIPHYPVDDIYWSGDGSLFTITHYDSARPVPERFLSRTAEGARVPLQLPGALLTEWAPGGTSLLVRYGSHLEVRDASGAALVSVPVPASGVHQWGPGGSSLLLWAALPLVAGGEAFVDVPVVWPKPGAMKVPNLAGPRAFSPDGRFFSGTVRTGPHEGRLVIYRCVDPVGSPEASADLRAAFGGAALKGRLMRPVTGPISQFMERGHTGIDVGAPLGSPILAAEDGIVRSAGWVGGGGYRVCLAHTAALETCYFHTSAILVGPGQRVVKGQPIALIGMSGLTRGPHLHWEARHLGRLVDPLER